MWRPHCGWSTLGRLNTLDAGKARLDGFHQRRQRGLHGAEHDDRLLAHGAGTVKLRAVGVSTHSIIGQAITGNPARKNTPPAPPPGCRLKPAILLYGVGMMRRALREYAHVEAVHVVGPVGLPGRALLARHVAHALADQLGRLGVQRQRHASARAAHWRV